MLTNKTIYCIVTGAHRTTNIAVFLDMLKSNRAANIILIPTPAAIPFLDLETLPSDVIVRYESNGFQQIPEEDLVVVAPCTFNTFSKIASGIADNYAMSILHAAIGKKKPVIVAPSMGTQYWWHPIINGYIKTINSFGIEVVWPEYVRDLNGNLEKITMAPWAKILDSVCHKYQKIRYQDFQLEDKDASEIITIDHYATFAHYGGVLQREHYTNAAAGFLAMRLNNSKILITRTGALVGNLSKDDLSVITNHSGHVVSWCGKHKPSSETPLALDIFDNFPEANVIIHGHCRDITYSPKMVKYLSDEYLSYGQWGEYIKITSLLREHNFAIMRLHGEIVIGKDFEEALNHYLEMYKKTL